MKKELINQSYILLCAFLILILPSNLFLKFAVETAYVNGLLVDYLLPKLYASDVIIFFILGMWLLQIFFSHAKIQWQKLGRVLHKPVWLIGIVLIVLLLGRQFLTAKPLAALWFFAKLSEILLLIIFFWRHRGIFQKPLIWWSWLVSILVQASLGIYQFFTQQSFFPSYYFFGEINYQRPLFLAKATFNGVEKILPYGSTPHPDIWAGFLGVGTGIILANLGQIFPATTRQTWTFRIGLGLFFGLITWAIYLSQSISALLCLLLIGVVLLRQNKNWPQLSLPRSWLITAPQLLFSIIAALIFMTPFILHQLAIEYPLNLSFVRRDQLNQAATAMITDHPFIGVGMNNFTAVLEKYFFANQVVRFIQPVHNVFLLWWTETGFLGVGVLGWMSFLFWSKLAKEKVLLSGLALLPLLLFDHYLLTQQTGLLLIVFFFLQFCGGQLIKAKD